MAAVTFGGVRFVREKGVKGGGLGNREAQGDV